MIIHCSTVRFISEVLENEEYSFLYKDLVVMDLGCNIGTFSLWIMKNAKVIHAVDISVENIEHLNNTLRDNLIPNIKTYCVGISGKTETRKALRRGKPEDGGWGIDEAGDFLIDTYSLNDFMSRNGIPYIDVLKMDVEGAEAEIVEAPDFPSDRVSTIIGEYHGDRMERTKRALDLKGYRWTDFGGGHFTARR